MTWTVKYDGPCSVCSRQLHVGEEAVYVWQAKRLFCPACAPGDRPPAPPPLSRGNPGASTRREHDRRLANDEAKLAERWGPRIGGWISTARDERQTTRAFASGAYGEERLAGALAKVPGIEYLHDRRIPGNRGNIDHIVVAPAGLFVVDTKRYRGRVELKRRGSVLHPEYRLYASGFDRTSDIDGVKALAAIVDRAVIENRVEPQPIAVPILCFVDAERADLGSRAHDGVLFESEHSIRDLLLSDVGLAPGQIDHVARQLGRLFPPK